MTNYKEIFRLHSQEINNTRIAESCGCARSTVIAALQRAREQDLSWNKIKNCSTEEVAWKLGISPLHWASSTRCQTTGFCKTKMCRCWNFPPGRTSLAM